MARLANLTQTDINNGVLNRMLANVGIPDVQQYIENFHRETEDLIIEEFEHPNPSTSHDDEQIVPPADIQSWITGLRPRLDDPIKPSLPKQQQPSPPPPPQQQLPTDVQGWIRGIRPVITDSVEVTSSEQQSKQEQQQLPADVQRWITRLRPHLEDPVQPPVPEQQQQQQQQPSDLKSWMQRMAPNSSHSSTHTTPSETTTTATDNDAPVTGNLGSWLNDWSKSLTEQPPPASLDNWLKGLIPPNMNEPIGKTNSSKGRLNSYLNAAQDVLSKNGYNVSNEVALSTNVKNKTGMFGNVKHMYFLVSFLVLFSSLHLDILFLLFYLVENIR
jgi:ATP-dependent exoDNAse (exonuclease V) beta subunit